MLTTVLFDLDGTLLPMDQDVFVRDYFHRLAKKVAPLGYDPKALVDTVWAGTAAMVKNDGSQTNEEAFWRVFADRYGAERLRDRPAFDEFYRTDFQQTAQECGRDPDAHRVVEALKAMGLRLALATNPIFPRTATHSRVRWAGLEPEAFEYITTYENSTHSKPNPAYYADVLTALGLRAEECLMVGNDVGEDMVAETLGMRVFLLTNCLINRDGADISRWPRGGFDELLAYVRHLRHPIA